MPAKRLHFLGIAGSTMAGIAVACRERGYEVTGTDPGAYPPVTDWLDEQKITWWRKPDATHLDGVDEIVISGGTLPDDIELVAAHERNVPITSYAKFIGTLTAEQRSIVIAGTHGKTTTTSLVAWLLEAGGKQPDFLIGIQPRNFDTSVRLGGGAVVILEGDEYKASSLDERSKFSYYHPDVMAVTSLEMDHPDLFKGMEDISRRFIDVVKSMPTGGRFLYCADYSDLAAVAKAAACPTESYGESGDWQATGIRYEPEGIAFDVQHAGSYVGHFAAPLYGRHNVANCLAAIAVVLGEGLDAKQIQAGLAGFRGAARRFAFVSAPEAAVKVIDDYAHHPTEIAATIEAARAHFDGRIIAVVRPHTYSRVTKLLPEFRHAVAQADRAFVTDIEGAREQPVTGSVVAREITNGLDGAVYEPDRTALVDQVVAAARPGDVVLSMTVSGYEGLAAELARRLQP